jgi:hypothetical protein
MYHRNRDNPRLNVLPSFGSFKRKDFRGQHSRSHYSQKHLELIWRIENLNIPKIEEHFVVLLGVLARFSSKPIFVLRK